MRAHSCNTEIDIILSSEEIKKLKENSLEGTLKFWFREEDKKRIIPITINYDPLQKELFEIVYTPKEDYLGNAKKINFVINKEDYTSLVENGISGGRFWSSGKLRIMSENFKL